MDPSVPLLMCLPLDENWVDITAGDPESHEFFALRASPKAVPLVSEVPYTLDEDFLTALSHMPEASGVALGFDRLVMLALGAPRIDDVIWTPLPDEIR